MDITHEPRAFLTALYHAAVEGAAPFERTRDAVAAWWQAYTDGMFAGLVPASPASVDAPSPPPSISTTDVDVDAPDDAPPHDVRAALPASVHVFALGKAAPAMTAGAIAALADVAVTIAGGVVIAAHEPGPHELGAPDSLPEGMASVVGDHPVPGPRSLDAGDAIDAAVLGVQPGDIAVVLISGGATSLAAAPTPLLSQAIGDAGRAQTHIANLAETLLESGLAIHEMNAIRRRLLRWGAGRLAVALAARGALLIPVFAISDVIGDDPSVIGSGPCTPDPLDDAAFLALVDAHGVRGALERSVAHHLGVSGTGPVAPVPPIEHDAFRHVTFTLVARNIDAVHALAAAAVQAGIRDVVVEDHPLTGDAAALGDLLARRAVALAHARKGRTLIVAGGEPVVNLRATFERAWSEDDAHPRDRSAAAAGDDDDVLLPLPAALDGDDSLLSELVSAASGESGGKGAPSDEPLRGGRMQLLSLAAALALDELAADGERSAARITVLAAGTDGRDGPTDAAGAIVDAATVPLARRARRAPERDAALGRSYYPLDAADALLRTGPTGTNVMDIVAVFIDDA